MTIPFNELTNNISKSGRWSSSGWYYNYSGIENKHMSMIMLCILYHNQKISRKSFTARMQAEQSLDRRLKTYKSIVLDEWFQDTHITDVLVQEAETCNNRDLTFEEYFTYLNIGLSRNRNWVVNWIAFSIYKAMLNADANHAYRFINASNLIEISPISYEEADRMYDLSSGFCCDDCDGDYYSYKQSKYQHYYRLNEKDVLKPLFEAFKKLKTHLRNPDDKLLNEFL